MIRKEMSDAIRSLAEDEKSDAIRNHGLFHSDHEAYAVIKEELEEAAAELSLMSSCLDTVWNRAKRDMDISTDIKDLKSLANRCACECVQVEAMCSKYEGK